MFNSNIGPNLALLRDISLQNLCDLDFELNSDGGSGLTIYGFLSMCNSYIGPNVALLRDMSLQNLGDLEFNLSKKITQGHM